MENKGRIEYIDAIRGFTMLLVVIEHVCIFGLSSSNKMKVDGYTSYFVFTYEFMLPLFFFISGFVFYRSDRIWTINESLCFLRKKTPTLILTPLLFMLAFIHVSHIYISITDALCNHMKAGYWFVFTLFEFYCFYILSKQILDLFIICKNRIQECIIYVLSLLLYCLTVPTLCDKWPLDPQISNLIGIPVWGYYLYLVSGTLVKKHFARFERILDETPLLLLCILIYLGCNIWSEYIKSISSTGFNLATAYSGIIIVFAFFRKHQNIFKKQNKLGITLQYIGRRTLDIYLIHYFFVFSNMQAILPNFRNLNAPFLEFICSFAISIFVIAASLLISSIIRMSPIIAHYMFGEKDKI